MSILSSLRPLAAAALALSAAASQAGVVFSEDFEGSLVKWNPIGSAQIVADPFLNGNDVLNFKQLGSGGDIFSAQPYIAGGSYYLSFDILGTCASGNCGGFIGIDQFPGGEIWIAGDNTYGTKLYQMQNNGQWQHFEFAFTANTAGNFRVKIEDFVRSAPAGDVYFDNICISTVRGDSSCSTRNAVPEPGSLALAGLALLGAAAARRRRA